jgi:arabinofuranosyltransferase
MGGDYMHARMFLPATFAALLPVAAVPLRLAAAADGETSLEGASLSAAALRARFGHLVVVLCTVLVLGWCVLCARSLRVPVENQCGIGDERGWCARMAEVDNPVRIEQYEKHPSHVWGRGLVDTIRKSCPELETATQGSPAPGCRLTFLSPDEAREVFPALLTYPFAPQVDPRLLGQISQGAMGIAGFLLPDNVHLFDVHGLADPFVSRVELKGRGRPGHEKTLPVAWRLARYTAPTPGEDATISSARRALGCGALATLEQAVRAPLDARQFFANLGRASTHTKLRIPSDPFDAEARYCHTPRWRMFTTSGGVLAASVRESVPARS